MDAGIDGQQHPDYSQATKRVSLRESIRRNSPTAQIGNAPSQSSPEGEEAKDRKALLDWLTSANRLLTAWYEHFSNSADRPIELAEIEKFTARLSEIQSDLSVHLYSRESLLSRLGYAERVSIWESELTGPLEKLRDVVNPYRYTLRRVDPADLDDNPAMAIEFDEKAYKRSKRIRRLFARYRDEINRQVRAIQGLLEHGM
jgi:hypothetical protein